MGPFVSGSSGHAVGGLGPRIDTSVANEARVYDYLLGGSDSFEVDRRAAEAHARAAGGIDRARHAVRANRQFLGRVVRYLADDAGIGQFLDIGSGIPTGENVHAVAQQARTSARVVYVDRDPVALSRAHEVLGASANWATAYIDSDMRHPDGVIQLASPMLDFAAPVAVLFVSVLHFLADAEGPYGLVRAYLERLVPGSFLVTSHLAADIQPQAMAALASSADADTIAYRFHPRSRAQVERFFDGLEVVAPGVVPVEDWRAESQTPPPPDGRVPPFHAGVGQTR